MVSSIQLFAVYTQGVNDKLHVLLKGLGPQAYAQERNTFFKSLQGLHLHLVQSTKSLQANIRTASGGKYLVSPLTEAAFEVNPGSLDEACRLQAEYDALFLAFSRVFDGNDAALRGSRTLRSGKVIELSVADLLTQYMVHTAHHRGQVSQLLDELGVDHDFGSLWGYLS
jgi:uncharacterized damage-inducible protein DinB